MRKGGLERQELMIQRIARKPRILLMKNKFDEKSKLKDKLNEQTHTRDTGQDL